MPNFGSRKFSAQHAIEVALDMEECFWKEKARVKWHLEDDRNTYYLHRVTKIKHKLKPISLLEHMDRVISDHHEIAACTVNYFQNLFSSNSNFVQDFSLVDDTISLVVEDNMNGMLTRLPSMEEISAGVFSLNKDNVPQSDGLGRFFSNILGYY